MTYLVRTYQTILLCVSLGCCWGSAANQPIKIMLLGSDHLAQLYDDSTSSDVFNPQKQAELAAIRHDLAAFQPQQIMVEVDVVEQVRLDDEFHQIVDHKTSISHLPFGRSEVYQLGFKLAQEVGLTQVYAVDAYDYFPQNALDSGDNYPMFQQGLQQLMQLVRPLARQVKSGELSLYDYYLVMNQPENIALSQRTIFNTPAYVTNGNYREKVLSSTLSDEQQRYIGADYIARFYSRNLKIYSNILAAQQQQRASRVLLIIGQLHVGVLASLLNDNPRYQVISPLHYLARKGARF